MKYIKTYENNNENFANELANRIANKFFDKLSGFNRIEIEKSKYIDKNIFYFYFCFSSILPSTFSSKVKVVGKP